MPAVRPCRKSCPGCLSSVPAGPWRGKSSAPGCSDTSAAHKINVQGNPIHRHEQQPMSTLHKARVIAPHSKRQMHAVPSFGRVVPPTCRAAVLEKIRDNLHITAGVSACLADGSHTQRTSGIEQTHAPHHLKQMSVPVVVRVLGVRGEAVGDRHAVGDAFQRVRPPAPLVRGNLVIEDRQIVRADLFRLRTSNIEQGTSRYCRRATHSK